MTKRWYPHKPVEGPWTVVSGYGSGAQVATFWRLEDRRRVNSFHDYTGPICEFDDKEQAEAACVALNKFAYEQESYGDEL